MIPEAEEHPAVPARASDGAGNGRQRLVGPPLPFESVGGDGDDLFDALPLAQESRPGDRAVAVGANAALLALAAVQFLAQPFQPPDRLRFQPAKAEFLNAVGQPGFKVAAIERRRLAVEQLAPLRFQIWCRRGLQRGQARGDGIMSRHAVLRCVGVA